LTSFFQYYVTVCYNRGNEPKIRQPVRYKRGVRYNCVETA